MGSNPNQQTPFANVHPSKAILGPLIVALIRRQPCSLGTFPFFPEDRRICLKIAPP